MTTALKQTSNKDSARIISNLVGNFNVRWQEIVTHPDYTGVALRMRAVGGNTPVDMFFNGFDRPSIANIVLRDG